MRRTAPALALLVLSPLISEFLLGDFSVRQLGFVLVLIPQYGGGALLVREITRRARRGWPTMMLLALAYALIEEGFTTQTLFNPNYAGQRLLDYGYIPALGTSLNWSVFVLTLHVVWSVSSSVAVIEALAGSRWATPWLGKSGLAATSLLFLLGCGMTTVFTMKTYPFVATTAQFMSIALATVVAIAAAFGLFRARTSRVPGPPPSVWLIGALSLVFCSSFYLLYARGSGRGLPPTLTLAGMVALELTAIVLFTIWSRRADWGPLHVLAAATGAILTYGWISVSAMVGGRTHLGVPTTTVDVVGQMILLLGILAVVYVGSRRVAGVQANSTSA